MQTIRNYMAALLLVIAPLAALADWADLAEGDRLPSLDIRLLNGDTLSASQVAGKPTAYLFWATWCPICREELPAYQALHNTYKAQGFRVVAISLDESVSQAAEFWKSRAYTFPVAMRTGEIREAFGRIKGTPTLYLIDGKGRLNLKHMGSISMDELAARVKTLL